MRGHRCAVARLHYPSTTIFDVVKFSNAAVCDCEGLRALENLPDIAASGGKAPSAALLSADERLRLATEVADIGCWEVEEGHGQLLWPPRVKALFGISADAAVTMDDFYNGLHPDDRERVAAVYAGAADPERRTLYDVEYRTIGKEDGIVRWVAAKGRGVFDEAGRCQRMIGTAIDITDRMQAQEEKLARQREEAQLREQFIAVLGHDLRNPLAAIAAGTHLLLRHPEEKSRDCRTNRPKHFADDRINREHSRFRARTPWRWVCLHTRQRTAAGARSAAGHCRALRRSSGPGYRDRYRVAGTRHLRSPAHRTAALQPTRQRICVWRAGHTDPSAGSIRRGANSSCRLSTPGRRSR